MCRKSRKKNGCIYEMLEKCRKVLRGKGKGNPNEMHLVKREVNVYCNEMSGRELSEEVHDAADSNATSTMQH